MPYQIVWVDPDPTEETDENVGMEYRCEADGVVLAIYRDTDPDSNDPDTVITEEFYLHAGDLVQLYRDDVKPDDPLAELLRHARDQDPGDA